MASVNSKAFGQNVHRFRSAKGMTQERFAEAIEVSRTYLQSIERGKSNPTILVAERITRVCHCSWDELMAGVSRPGSSAKRI
jgi:transcriptional regulator with XRE-family HTH domain